jgi:hypothetical protein
MQSRMSSTLNTNESLSSLTLLKKMTPKLMPELAKTKQSVHKDLKSVIKQTKQCSYEKKQFCSTFIVDFSSTPIKIAPKTSTPIKLNHK